MTRCSGPNSLLPSLTRRVDGPRAATKLFVATLQTTKSTKGPNRIIDECHGGHGCSFIVITSCLALWPSVVIVLLLFVLEWDAHVSSVRESVGDLPLPGSTRD